MSTTAPQRITAGILLVLLAGCGVWLRNLFVDVQRTTSWSNCGERLQPLNRAVSLYAQDNDDGFPLGLVDGRPSALGWSERIRPYAPDGTDRQGNIIRNHLPLRCPSDDRDATFSYAMNVNVEEIRKLSWVRDPDRAVLLFEVKGSSASRLAPTGYGVRIGMRDSVDPQVPALVRPAEQPDGRHKEFLNYALASGLVRRAKVDEVSRGINARTSLSAEISDCLSLAGGVLLPCAEGLKKKTRTFTFSLR